MPRYSLPGACFAVLVLSGFAHAADPQEKVDFSRDVMPILSDNCFKCHGPDEKARKADLRLDTKADLLRTDSPVVVPGKSAASELVRRLITTDADELMPPPKSNKKLTAAQIATLKRWVDEGATWGTHWAFTPPRRPDVPRMTPQPANPIDAFVRARLQHEGLKPAVPASKAVLIRRVTLDLTGLPPTPEEVQAFLGDNSPQAYDKLVDRLLASPRYGERMAWDWLDAARYADSNGYQGDGERTMWPWRDWVVQAFNDNMPYDRFTVWQIAGDLLPKPTREQILATAFNRNHMINGEGGRIAEENRVEYVFDQAETVGTIWLGLTMTCSRCHDHKFDPITRKDYYQLFAYFNQTPVNGGGGNGQTPPVLEFITPAMETKRKEVLDAYDGLLKTIVPIEERLRKAGMVKNKDGKDETTLPAAIDAALSKGPNGRTDQTVDELAKFFKEKEPEYAVLVVKVRAARQLRDVVLGDAPKVMVMQDMPKPRDTFILTRGTYDRRETTVQPGIPAVFQRPGQPAQKNRLNLARWIVSPENPLTARVTVNRLWQTFFGTGIVKTSEDFGVQSERPSHPELLDWLASEFVNPTRPAETPGTSWDVKHLVRLIVTSEAYRQDSRSTAEQRERDPENRLLARGPRHRLPSWMIRDQALAASGLLTPTIGGPSVKPYQPPGIWEEATFGNKQYRQDNGAALYRRSLYVFWRRIVGPTMFFDSANRQTCTVKTTTTNTPLHALATLNDTTYVEAARVLAQRALEKGGSSDEARVAFAFQLAVARTPTKQEVAILMGALDRQRKLFAADPVAAAKLLKVGESPRNQKLDAVEHAAFTALCTLILNLDETLTKQ